jgi:anti-sigma regulatory factor (Ser/Thr protein kinase)
LHELSLHILDIAENGVEAGADLIRLSIMEDRKNNWLRMTIADNGCGISDKMLKTVTDPFFTTKKTRRVGLGFSLLSEASKRCGGKFNIKSEEGERTQVSVSFRLDHIDLAPMGDITGTITSLIMGNPEVDFVYIHKIDGKTFNMDTRDIRNELVGVPIYNPQVLKHIATSIQESMKELNKA